MPPRADKLIRFTDGGCLYHDSLLRFVGHQARLFVEEAGRRYQIQGEVANIELKGSDEQPVLVLTYRWAAIRPTDACAGLRSWIQHYELEYRAPLAEYQTAPTGHQYCCLVNRQAVIREILLIQQTAHLTRLDPTNVQGLETPE